MVIKSYEYKCKSQKEKGSLFIRRNSLCRIKQSRQLGNAVYSNKGPIHTKDNDNATIQNEDIKIQNYSCDLNT